MCCCWKGVKDDSLSRKTWARHSNSRRGGMTIMLVLVSSTQEIRWWFCCYLQHTSCGCSGRGLIWDQMANWQGGLWDGCLTKKKRKEVMHVNMPKEWVSLVVNTSYFVGCEAEELEEDGTVLLQEEDQDNEGNLCTGKHLDGRQLRELQDLLNKYSNVKQSKPVRTSPSRAQHWDRCCKTSKTTTILLASCLTKMKCSRNWSRWRRTV